MTYEEIVEYARKKVAAANLKSYKGHLAAQVDITGEGEGAFYIELTDGNANVQPYEYKDHDIKLISSAEVFIAVLDGKKSAVEAVTNGELAVAGNTERALELADLLTKKPAVKKAAPAKKEEAKPAAKKTTAKKAEAKPEVKKAAPAKKAEAKPAEKAKEEAKKTAVATAKKNVSKKATTK